MSKIAIVVFDKFTDVDYEQNGFEQVGEERSDEFFGTPWFVMEKNLDRKRI